MTVANELLDEPGFVSRVIPPITDYPPMPAGVAAPVGDASDAVPDAETAVALGITFLKARFGQAILDQHGDFSADPYDGNWLVVPMWRSARIVRQDDGTETLEIRHGPHPMVIVGRTDGRLIKLGFAR